jgi:hypothetical protein
MVLKCSRFNCCIFYVINFFVVFVYIIYVENQKLYAAFNQQLKENIKDEKYKTNKISLRQNSSISNLSLLISNNQLSLNNSSHLISKMNQPLPSFTVKAKLLKNITLISLNKPVISNTRGNLGDANVVTNENINDWLKDRWQGF